MSQTWKPWPAPDPDWPDYVKAIYAAGCERIDRLRSQIVDGVCPLPFTCYGCNRERFDFGMMTGDGVPLCEACLNGCVDAITQPAGAT